MIDWKKRYYLTFIILIFIFVLTNINTLILAVRIEQKDDEIWQQRIEIEDLKEQIENERIKNKV
ncbi:MAG: hypothetical protein U0L98_01895 [Clostridia bacterium]|nr:hypothetical protein [Clostridia bacterium]